jgi:hypothetical protein
MNMHTAGEPLERIKKRQCECRHVFGRVKSRALQDKFQVSWPAEEITNMLLIIILLILILGFGYGGYRVGPGWGYYGGGGISLILAIILILLLLRVI